jgi:glycosyltransferase involved in cell wall biosynthesis
MLSNFGRADGGRETWAYNFIPRLLQLHPDLRLRIYGFRVEGQPDHSSSLLGIVPDVDRGRVSIEFVEAARNRIPNAFAFWRGIPALAESSSPQFALAVGSFVELLAVLRTRSFRSSRKIVWLRSIFADEKAHRYPPAMRPLLERAEVAVLRRADLIIANGEDTAEHYRRFGLAVTVIPNAIDLDRWRMPAPALKPPLQVAYVGRLAPVKGIGEFLEAASMAEAEGALERFSFHVIGEGNEADLAEVRKRPWVRYQGAVANDAVRDFVGRMDVCVGLTFVSSKAGQVGGAGISHALLEQAAAGRVMACWDNAIYRQVLDDDSGYLVRQGSASALWQALQEIADDTEAAQAKAERAASVAARFGLDEHVRLFDQAVAKLMEGTALRA